MREKEETYSAVKKGRFINYLLKKVAKDARNEFFNILKKKQNILKKIL
jgi:hypothetical protein